MAKSKAKLKSKAKAKVNIPKFDKIMSPVRLKKTSVSGRNLDIELLSDKSRLVSSSSFRRLQAKTQVFSLQENAAVRSRLTHSIEVSAIGELTATKIFSELSEKGLISAHYSVPFITAVENACLMHDIGNPPFGHFGESAIRSWLVENESDLAPKDKKSEKDDFDKHYMSLKCFDGNAQGFRIVTRLQWHKNEFGLNLTLMQLGAFLKYPYSLPKAKKSKIGFFLTEEKVFNEIEKKLKYPVTEYKHPLNFIMEASDDIAYCLSDIEDGIEKKIITSDMFFEYLQDEVRTAFKTKEITPKEKSSILEKIKSFTPKKNRNFVKDDSYFIDFKIGFTRWLIDEAVKNFMSQNDKILNGTYGDSLLSNKSIAGKLLSYVKKIARRYLFSSKEAFDIELSGYTIVHQLLKSFLPLLKVDSIEFEKILNDEVEKGKFEYEKRLAWLLPKKHFKVYRHMLDKGDVSERILRIQLVIDYIAGMTDTHALKVFQILKGIKIGVRS